MTSERFPPAFEDAVLAFVAAKVDATDALASDLMKLSDDDWQRSRSALLSWIDRDCREAPAYRRVVEMVDYQRGPERAEAC